MSEKFNTSMLIKRTLDFLIALLLLIVLSPLYLIVYIQIRRKLGAPAIFKQKRPGYKGRIFTLYKFRTMKDGSGPDSERLTKTGKRIRSLSLDELPQLVNVVKGDMSFVGPRPLLVEYLNLYSPEHKKRHNMKPGITGLAQVRGRNLLTWRQKFDYDVEYVKNWSLLLDVKILLTTIRLVLKKSGVSSNTSETMEKFTGENLD